jgi:hypothetical protein
LFLQASKESNTMSKLKQQLWFNEWVTFLLVAVGCIGYMDMLQHKQASIAWRRASDLLADFQFAYAQDRQQHKSNTPSCLFCPHTSRQPGAHINISTSSDVWALAELLTATARPPQAMVAAFGMTQSEAARRGVQGLAALRLRDIAEETLSSKTLDSIPVVLAGSLDDVVQQLEADSTTKQLKAAHVLHSLSQIDGPVRAVIVALPGCKKGLAALLNSRSDAVQEVAAATVANLALHPVSRMVLETTPDLLHTLMGLLESSGSRYVQAAAADALQNLGAIVPVKGREDPSRQSSWLDLCSPRFGRFPRLYIKC